MGRRNITSFPEFLLIRGEGMRVADGAGRGDARAKTRTIWVVVFKMNSSDLGRA